MSQKWHLCSCQIRSALKSVGVVCVVYIKQILTHCDLKKTLCCFSSLMGLQDKSYVLIEESEASSWGEKAEQWNAQRDAATSSPRESFVWGFALDPSALAVAILGGGGDSSCSTRAQVVWSEKSKSTWKVCFPGPNTEGDVQESCYRTKCTD